MHSKFAQAINFFDNGNLNESKKLCLKILKEEPKNFDILHLLGIISFKLEDYKNSADLIAKAVTINPKDAEAYNNQALVLKKINKLEDAIESLNQAIKIKPDFIQAYNRRGHLLVELNQLDDALENFNKAIEINPNFAEAYNNRGNILNKLNRHTESIESYDKAISINPNFAEAYNNRGGVQKDLKLYEAAHESYEKAIKIKPNLDFLLGSLIYTKLHLCNWKSFDENLKKIEESIINILINGSTDLNKRFDVIAIPSTAGTGAEVTPFATIWDDENKKKYSLASSELYPTAAIISPSFVRFQPISDVTTSIGIKSHSNLTGTLESPKTPFITTSRCSEKSAPERLMD